MTQQERWVVVVTNDCVSTGQCVETAPDLFVLNAEGYSSPILKLVGPDRVDDLRQAAGDCPVGAIEFAPAEDP